jgi:hypothetical protein
VSVSVFLPLFLSVFASIPKLLALFFSHLPP